MNYKEVIESKYNRQKWQVLLHDIFGSKADLWASPYEISTNSDLSKQTFWLGTITLCSAIVKTKACCVSHTLARLGTL